MNVSAPHICLCSSRGVRCLIMVEGLNGRRLWTANFEIYSPEMAFSDSSVSLLLDLYYL